MEASVKIVLWNALAQTEIVEELFLVDLFPYCLPTFLNHSIDTFLSTVLALNVGKYISSIFVGFRV